MSALIDVVINGRPARLHPECEAGFRADRERGVVYGPYIIYDGTTHARRFADTAEEASIIGNFCPYCSKE